MEVEDNDDEGVTRKRTRKRTKRRRMIRKKTKDMRRMQRST